MSSCLSCLLFHQIADFVKGIIWSYNCDNNCKNIAVACHFSIAHGGEGQSINHMGDFFCVFSNIINYFQSCIFVISTNKVQLNIKYIDTKERSMK